MSDLSDLVQAENSNIKWSIFSWVSAANNSATVGAWSWCWLTTTVENSIKSCSLSSNQVSIPAGNYIVIASKILQRTSNSRIGVYDVTNSTMRVEGINTYCYPSSSYGYKNVMCEGILEPTATTAYELRYFVRSAGSYGQGSYVWSGNVLATISFGKLPE